MSDQQTPPSEDQLQFDVAEQTDAQAGTAATTPCAVCQQPISGYYYEANGSVLCTPCRENLGTALAGGSGAIRFVRALVLGIIAAAMGSALYFVILKVSGYEFALIAIIVGLAVGVAVRKGAQARGGWVYQAMAVALTYTAIACTYIPMIYEGVCDGYSGALQKHLNAATNPAEVSEQFASVATVHDGKVELNATARHSVLIHAIWYAFKWPLIQKSIFGYIILAVGLYEAFKINKPVRFTVSGPYAVGQEAPAPAVSQS